jgi:hypothetical protein
VHEERQVRQITSLLECQVRTDSWTVELQSEILDSFAGMSFENNLKQRKVETFSDWRNVRCRIFKSQIPRISTAQI